MNDRPEISTNPIPLTAVEGSRQIAALGYDPETSTLAIQFKPRAGEAAGSIYHYGGVPPEVFEQFQGAQSKGNYFYANIRNETEKYPFVKIAEPVIAESQQAA